MTKNSVIALYFFFLPLVGTFSMGMSEKEIFDFISFEELTGHQPAPLDVLYPEIFQGLEENVQQKVQNQPEQSVSDKQNSETTASMPSGAAASASDHSVLNQSQDAVHQNSLAQAVVLDAKKNSEKKLSCLVLNCPEKFNRMDNVKLHVKRVHVLQAKKYQCSICNASYDQLRNLTIHRNLHNPGNDSSDTSTGRFKCKDMLCPQTFIYPVNARMHYKRSHCTPKKAFACNQCTASYNLEFSLIDHKRWHTPASVQQKQKDTSTGRFKCSDMLCPQIFIQSGHASTHYKNCHCIPRRTFACDQCTASYDTGRTLALHKKWHTPASDQNAVSINANKVSQKNAQASSNKKQKKESEESVVGNGNGSGAPLQKDDITDVNDNDSQVSLRSPSPEIVTALGKRKRKPDGDGTTEYQEEELQDIVSLPSAAGAIAHSSSVATQSKAADLTTSSDRPVACWECNKLFTEDSDLTEHRGENDRCPCPESSSSSALPQSFSMPSSAISAVNSFNDELDRRARVLALCAIAKSAIGSEEGAVFAQSLIPVISSLLK